MQGQVKIKFSAIIIGVQKAQATFAAPEAMVNIVRKSDGSKPAALTVNHNKVSKLVEEYTHRMTGRSDCVDVEFTITTDDGYTSARVMPRGFETEFGQADYAVAMVAPKPAPVIKAAPKAEATNVKESRYVSKVAVNLGNQSRLPAGADSVGGRISGRHFEWLDKTDVEDSVPDSQLTPKQLERRKRLEQESEARAFNKFKKR